MFFVYYGMASMVHDTLYAPIERSRLK